MCAGRHGRTHARTVKARYIPVFGGVEVGGGPRVPLAHPTRRIGLCWKAQVMRTEHATARHGRTDSGASVQRTRERFVCATLSKGKHTRTRFAPDARAQALICINLGRACAAARVRAYCVAKPGCCMRRTNSCTTSASKLSSCHTRAHCRGVHARRGQCSAQCGLCRHLNEGLNFSAFEEHRLHLLRNLQRICEHAWMIMIQQWRPRLHARARQTNLRLHAASTTVQPDPHPRRRRDAQATGVAAVVRSPWAAAVAVARATV